MRAGAEVTAAAGGRHLPPCLSGLRLPVVASPMFIASGPELVIQQCLAGIVGTFPALNARPAAELDGWIARVRAATDAPFGVNLIAHHSNDRLEVDLACCVRWRVPVVITSVGDPRGVVEAVHAYGGIVLHDVINRRHAEKAAAAGVDGLILVCAGAGGHGGNLSPFAFLAETRSWFNRLLLLAGGITRGEQILAARLLGADLVYMGTRFLGASEANVPNAYRAALLAGNTSDIVYTDVFSGVHANFLRASIVAVGLDPDALRGGPGHEDFSSAQMDGVKVWRDIWSAGHGVATIECIEPAASIVAALEREYQDYAATWTQFPEALGSRSAAGAAFRQGI